MPDLIHFTHIHSPIGQLMIAATEDGLHAIEFPENRHPVARDGKWVDVSDHPQWQAACAAQGITSNPTESGQHDAIAILIRTRQQLDEYFAGTRRDFDLPLAPQGTAFQRRVWQALRDIPFGHTWSYLQLAQHIGNPKGMRAVGAANGRNPIPIIIPCHRVIGANGSLVGFGGGLPTKVALLRLEGIPAGQTSPHADRSEQFSLLPTE
ncbi:MAG: methylated-DNA--[protein]-cysteine S-methyltransferase [Lautropia sp.]|nr:methylated-DNA--[protein]-cysteine S-methyltransferase [Lautropia sp.]